MGEEHAARWAVQQEDTPFISDFGARQNLELSVANWMPTPGAGDAEGVARRDREWRGWLAVLPPDERMLVERRSGIWTGRAEHLPLLGVEMDVEYRTAYALWQAGMARLRELIALAYPRP